MTTMLQCQVCHRQEPVCCSYLGKQAPYQYCAECCLWRKSHIAGREKYEADERAKQEPTLEQRVADLEATVQLLLEKTP